MGEGPRGETEGVKEGGEVEKAVGRGKGVKEGRGGGVAFCVNWAGHLEALRMSLDSRLGDVAKRVALATEAPPEHKFFLFKGRLLQDPTVELGNIRGLANGSVMHLVLNDDMPPLGRAVLVSAHSIQCWEGGQGVALPTPPPAAATYADLASKEAAAQAPPQLLTIMCSQHDTVEEVKEQLSLLPDMDAPQLLRLSFAGRVLQDRYSLREYNIQKPSVLQLLPPLPPCTLHRFVTSSTPAASETNVATSIPEIRLHLHVLNTHFADSMLRRRRGRELGVGDSDKGWEETGGHRCADHKRGGG
eukprot:CAMPEP_0179411690 /NCGR_PEP_ID=MMETSP0799-20121207/4043_1 /TAXON_ID=46947 /ORGANISM="Geminigera cryophila, Strain CCMP2564" /LENGTH=301 /DNA_ID=CAMNT_0021183799 /DNA_START=203 /DNA_END=1104 /DNA_ORIENTATION=+